MLKKRLIPLILYNDWKMVKTIRFTDIRNYGSPVVAAKVYNAQKVDEITYLDIRASVEEREPNFDAIRDIIKQCFMPVTIGGGVRTIEHVRQLLKIGADKVCLCTAAAKRPGFIEEAANDYGSSCIVVSIDVKNENGIYQVYTDSATEASGLDAVDWARQAVKLGAGELFINSIDNDGMMKGYDIELLKRITSAVNVPVIAGGGAGGPEHMVNAFEGSDVSAVAGGSIFLYTEHSPVSVRKYLKDHGVDVRPY